MFEPFESETSKIVTEAPAVAVIPPNAAASRLSEPFVSKAEEVAKRIGVKTSDVLGVIHFETAGTMDPQKINPLSGAIGLIQWTPAGVRATNQKVNELGIEPIPCCNVIDIQTFLKGKTAEQQLDYTVAYIEASRGGRSINNMGDLYLTVFAPVALGKSDDYIAYQKDLTSPGSLKDRQYTQNKGMDINNDGKITKAEILRRVQGRNNQFIRYDKSAPVQVVSSTYTGYVPPVPPLKT